MNVKKVFVFGSKTISKLTEEFRKKLDEYMNEGAQFMIGDCSGVDTAVQKYLNEHHYQNVEINVSYNWHTDSKKDVRNNVGNWDVYYVHTDCIRGTYEYRFAKDESMIHACQEGIGLWDGKTRGTKNNFSELEKAGKPCLQYICSRND